MTNVFYAFFLISLLFSRSFGLEGGRCGTLHYADEFKNPKKRALAKPGDICNANNLYETVHLRETEHFAIYYTTEGVHKAGAIVSSKDYIDTLAFYLEEAYKLHRDSLGMKKTPAGISKSFHYQQDVPKGKYPVEVADIGLLRCWEGKFSNAFGLTFTPQYRENCAVLTYTPQGTQIAIENDFLFGAEYGADCSGKPSKDSLSTNNVNYSVEWNSALKITAFHELYHAFQRMYFDWMREDSFWLEASAAGVEEIGAPDVDDYIGYLRHFFNYKGKSMEEIPWDSYVNYGYAALYLFLFSELGPKFDSHIWENFSNNKKENFSMQLARYASSLNIDAEDLFHKFARQVFFSGKRAEYADSLFWIDMPRWPEWGISTTRSSPLPLGAIDFTRAEPSDVFATKISRLDYGDDYVWVLSGLFEKGFVPPAPAREFIAYPNPWRNPNNPVRFNFLPEKATGVEIRTSNGTLLERIKGKSGDTLVWQPKKIPAPGILYYRYLPYGKNKALIAEY